jgi:hypothetical protein
LQDAGALWHVAGVEQVFPQPPQLFGSPGVVKIDVSQPFDASPSQSAKPTAHELAGTVQEETPPDTVQASVT